MVHHAPDEGAYCHACMVPTSQASVYVLASLVAWHQLGTYVTSIAYDPLPDANVEPAQPQLASEHVAVDPCFWQMHRFIVENGVPLGLCMLAHARAHTNKSILACQALSYRGRCLRTWDAVTRTNARKQGQIKCGSRPHQASIFSLHAREAPRSREEEGIKSHYGRVRDTS